jgi:hypothetical protein
MERNLALTTQTDTSAPRAPLCFKCRSLTNHRSRMSDVTSGDCYDTFQCSACDYVSWTQAAAR